MTKQEVNLPTCCLLIIVVVSTEKEIAPASFPADRQEGVAEASISHTLVGNLRQAATRYQNSRLYTLYLCIPHFDDSLTFLVSFVAK
jgi:hypothetical protein